MTESNDSTVSNTSTRRTCQTCGMSFVTSGNAVIARTPDGTLWACLTLEPGAPRDLVVGALLTHHVKGVTTLTEQARRSIIKGIMVQEIGQSDMGSFGNRSFGDLLVLLSYFPTSTALGSGEEFLIILNEDDPEAAAVRSINSGDNRHEDFRGNFTQGRRPYRDDTSPEDTAS